MNTPIFLDIGSLNLYSEEGTNALLSSQTGRRSTPPTLLSWYIFTIILRPTRWGFHTESRHQIGLMGFELRPRGPC